MSDFPPRPATSPDAALSVAIIGSGFGGLCLAIKLRQAGIDSFTILERESELGGTWWANQYPGAACDVPSHLYCFSFEPKAEWSRTYASQKEILDYLRHCTEKYDLRRHIRFNTEVTGARFHEVTGLWHVNTARGDTVKAQSLVVATGALSTPALPKIPGVDRFRGEAFHSAAWKHDYELEGKRVAVIGTGASAIQFVPEIAPRVRQLYLFQRTPPWIIKRPDRAYSEFQKRLFRALPTVQKLHRSMIYWRMEMRAPVFFRNSWRGKLAQLAARQHLKKLVRDRGLRKVLTPRYAIGCKRVLLSNDYYPALERPNVELVTAGISEIRAHSIVTGDGCERPVDAIIYATGFKAAQALSHLRFIGCDGVDINQLWRQQGGPQAYRGTTVAGFPNFFLIGGPNTGLGHNSIVYMIEAQVTYIVQSLLLLHDPSLKYLDVHPQAQADYNTWLQARMNRTVWATGCQSWYLTESGKNVTLWPGYTFAFRRQTQTFDAANYQLCPREIRRDESAITAEA